MCSGVTPETAGDGWKEDILKENGLPGDIRQPQSRPQVAEIRGRAWVRKRKGRVRGNRCGPAGRDATPGPVLGELTVSAMTIRPRA